MFLTPSLIAFEGTECAGKSTAMRSIKEWIEQTYNMEVVVVRVPGGTDTGMKIRGIVTGDSYNEISDTATALLFAADWRITLETVILPALKRGAMVLADRCNLSTYALQSKADDLNKIMEINNKVKTPDAIYVMTTPYEVFTERRDSRGSENNNARDYITKETHDAILERYVRYTDTHPANCVMVDCLRTPDEIAKDIQRSIAVRFHT